MTKLNLSKTAKIVNPKTNFEVKNQSHSNFPGDLEDLDQTHQSPIKVIKQPHPYPNL